MGVMPPFASLTDGDCCRFKKGNGMFCPSDVSSFPWMEYAFQEFGTREIGGRRDNAAIVRYLATVGLGSHHDETAWCSAFANWCMQQAGIPGSRRANARSWLNWGGYCLGTPHYGCVAILWRGRRNSWQGHVGFYVGIRGRKILLLGGNQGHSVSIKEYDRDRLLGYRWPQGYALPNIF